MPTENKNAVPCFDLNTPDGGRGYIANLFKSVLKRHDYRQYIAERLAGDFACTLAQHFDDLKAREEALQVRLNAADQRIDELTAAEQRNALPADWADQLFAEMERRFELCKQYHQDHMVNYDTQIGVEFAIEWIGASLKPTESGASE